MATIAFDTLKFAKRLKDAGVPAQQAEAEAEALNAAERLEELATRRDLKEMDASLRRDLKEAELRLEAKIAESNAALVRWVVSAGIVQTAIIGALVLSIAKG